jgi:hypothetical protein
MLRIAVEDLGWLLRRGYSPKAAAELVGNRYQLSARERLAMSHASWNRDERDGEVSADELRGAKVCIDGFNLLITLETALAGGVLIRGVDGRIRDLANVHGGYSLRNETETAIAITMEELLDIGISESIWYFDRPVSNSGRVAGLVRQIASQKGLVVRVETIDGVDGRLKECNGIVVTADSAILDSGVQWFDLADRVVEKRIPDAWVVDMKR